MKTSFFAYTTVALAAAALFGAGCSTSLETTPVTPVTPTPPVVVVPTSTASTLPANWLSFTHTAPNFSFGYPKEATVSSTNQAFPQDIAMFELGHAAVTNTTASSIPTRQLHVRIVDAQSPSIKNCFYSESNWSSGYLAAHQEQLVINGQTVCLSTENDAGAGNYYNTYNYSTKVGTQYVIMSFVAHSVNCLNYPDPAKQCVAFDETRDTALFKEMMNTFKNI